MVFMLLTSQLPSLHVIRVYIKAKVVLCVHSIPCPFGDYNLFI